MPRKHLNPTPNLGLGSPRLPEPPLNVPNDRNKRSPHDAFAYKFQTLSMKLLIFVLSQQLYTWFGQPMTLKNCPKLIDLYLCGKIKKLQFLKYLFKPNAIFQGFQYKDNNKNQNNEYLNQRLNKIVDYFKNNKIQLQLQREKIREIFNDFKFVLPYAFWFHVYAQRCQIDHPHIQQLDEQYERIHHKKFSRFVRKIEHLDMKPLCEPFMKKIRQRQQEKQNNISLEESQQFQRIKESQKTLAVEYRKNSLDKFLIRRSADSKNLSSDQKKELMKHLMEYNESITLLTDQQSTSNIFERYQPQSPALAPAPAPVHANVSRGRTRRNKTIVTIIEEGEIQIQRSRSPQRIVRQIIQIPRHEQLQFFIKQKQKDQLNLMDIWQNNSAPVLDLLDQLSNEKQNYPVYPRMQSEQDLHSKYPNQLYFSFKNYDKDQNNQYYFLRPY